MTCVTRREGPCLAPRRFLVARAGSGPCSLHHVTAVRQGGRRDARTALGSAPAPEARLEPAVREGSPRPSLHAAAGEPFPGRPGRRPRFRSLGRLDLSVAGVLAFAGLSEGACLGAPRRREHPCRPVGVRRLGFRMHVP